MSLKGPIILIEDDPDDLDVLVNALMENEVHNEIKTFTSASDALGYFLTTKDLPFLILCDIRMPGMNGLELRQTINDNDFLRKKSIPFIFYTVAVSQPIVDIAYGLTVQGFFEKPESFDALKIQLKNVIGYWSNCLHPNNLTLKHL